MISLLIVFTKLNRGMWNGKKRIFDTQHIKWIRTSTTISVKWITLLVVTSVQEENVVWDFDINLS